MFSVFPYAPRDPYQNGSGHRAAAMNYLVGRGMDPVSLAPQLSALGAITTRSLANVCWPNGRLRCPADSIESLISPTQSGQGVE